MATEEPVVSPRIAALRRAVESGDTRAVERFWAEIGEQGAPLVEPVTGDAHRVLVTFLWRAVGETRNVVVVGGLAGLDFTRDRMVLIPDTDVWYRSYRARDDLRTTYRFSPNDALTESRDVHDDAVWARRIATFQPDPLNPRRFLMNPFEPSRQELIYSILELPNAPPQPYAAKRLGAPAGRVHAHVLRSAILGNERDVEVYTPASYTTDGELYPLVLLFDGGAYTRLMPGPTTLDNLIAEGRIPSLVAIFLDNPDEPGVRSRELPSYPPFTDFLARELVPWIRERYHVTTDPARIVVGGSSYGGLAAAYAALTHSELFGNVLSQFGSFWWKAGWEDEDDPEEFEWHARQFLAARRLPIRFYLDVGLLDTAPSDRRDDPGQVAANRHFRDVLRAKRYEVHYAEFNGGHDYICAQGTLADGLIALLGIPQAAW